MEDFENFSAVVKPMAVKYDDVLHLQKGPPPPVKALLTINCRRKLTYAEKTAGSPGEEASTAILDQRSDKKETSLQLFLSELQEADLAPKLSGLGIERRHHGDVIRQVATCAQKVAAEIEAERFRFREAAFAHIHVEVKWLSFKWRVREMDRKISLLKEMVKGFRGNSFINGSSCSICLEDLEVGSKKLVVRTPCSDEFHEECLLAWLLKTSSCPLCRFDMPSNI